MLPPDPPPVDPEDKATSTPPVLPPDPPPVDPEDKATSTPPVVPPDPPPVDPEDKATSTPPVVPPDPPPVDPEDKATSTPPVLPPDPDGGTATTTATSTPPVLPPDPDGGTATTTATSTPPVVPPVDPEEVATTTPPVLPPPPAVLLRFDAAIEPQTYTAGREVSVTLPAAVGGAAPLTYRVEPALPEGLAFDSATRVISGAPARASPSTLYEFIVTDATGDYVSLYFFVTVDAAALQQAAATVSGVTITSTAPLEDGSTVPYPVAANIDVDVTFSGPIAVTGSPQLALTVGSRTRQAAHHATATSTVSFRYTVIAADRDGDGISIAANALTLNGGTIQSGGVDVSLGLGSHALAAQTAHQVHGGGASFDGVAAPAYTFEVGTSKTVTLPAADIPEAADYCNGNPGCSPYSLLTTPSLPSGLTFNDLSRELAGTPSATMTATTYTLRVNGDPLGQDDLSFTIEVTDSPPSVSGVSITSTPANGSSYAAAENIDVDVTFSAPVTVTGTPQLALTIGANTRQASMRAASGSTLSFRYPVVAADLDADGISIAAGALTLNSGTITETTGGRAARLDLGTHAVANSASHTVNDTAPSFGAATIESRQLQINGAITPIVLPTASGGDGTVTYTLTPATLPAGLTWTASTRTISGAPTTAAAATTYTWTATDGDADTATLTFSLTTLNPNGPAPDELNLSSTMVNYATGDTLVVLVRYPEKMVVDTTGGTPYLNLVIGDKTRRASYSASQSNTKNAALGSSDPRHYLCFEYVVQADDFDGDGIAIPADGLRLNGATLRTLAAPARDAKWHLGSHAVVSGDSISATMRVNDTAPTFGTVTIANRVYDVNASTTPVVLPTATGGEGALTYALTPTTLPAGMTWTAATRTIAGTPTATTTATTYTWTATDSDGDEAELTFTIEVRDPAGPAVSNVQDLRYAEPGQPTNSGQTNFAPGDTIRIMVSYPSKLTITGSPQLMLVIGDQKVKASYDSHVSGEMNSFIGQDDPLQRLVFSYEIQSDDWDGDGIAVPKDALLLNGGTIRTNPGGLDVKLSLGSHAIVSGDTTSVELRVQDTAPRLVSAASARSDVRIMLNESVNIALVGALLGDAPYTFSVTPALPAGLSIGTLDAETNTVTADAPNLVGQTSVAVTRKAFNLYATDRDGDRALLNSFNLSSGDAVMVDEVEILSSPAANNSYGAGESIEIGVGFDRALTLLSEDRITLSIEVGANTRAATFDRLEVTASSTLLVFAYTVVAADSDTDGISIGAMALQRNGAIVRDTETNINAWLDLDAHIFTNDSSHKVDGSVATAMAVEVVTLTSTPANTAGYDVGEVIKVRVTFTKPVTVTGAPQLALTLRSTQRQAAYQSAASGGDYLVFSYTVTTADRDDDGLSIAATALGLNSGTIQDAGGANAPLGLGTQAISNDSDHKVYTPPRVTGVTILSGPGVNGTYDAGETIQLYLDFSQRTSVHGGRAQVALTIGANTRQATWTPDLTGSNRYHVYQYTVTAADEDTNGISIGADALNLPTGVTLRDGVAYEDVALSLGSHAITDDSAHTVRDYAPTLPAIPAQHFIAGTAVNFVLPQGAGGNGALNYGISPTALPGGLTMVVSANATTTLTGTPTAAAVGGPTTYTWMVMDADGDVGMTEFDISIAAANAPQVTDVRIFSSPRAGSGNTYDADATRPIIVDVEFDQEVMVNFPQSGSGTMAQLALEIGSRTVQATMLPTLYGVVCTVNGESRPGASATDSGCAWDYTVLRFQYAVQGTDADTDGISIPAAGPWPGTS